MSAEPFSPGCSFVSRTKKYVMLTNKKFLLSILSVVFLGACVYTKPANAQSIRTTANSQLVLPGKTCVIPFYWQGDTIHSKWEPHTAILIPVNIAGCPRRFYMQFDLGSPYSILYKNKLTAIRNQYPAAIPDSMADNKLTNFSFTAGEIPVFAKEIAVKLFDSSTINWNVEAIEIIGTIGADLIDGRVVVIDYPLGKLALSETIPAGLIPGLALTDFVYAGRSVLFPAKIKGRQMLLYFDTGSSMYGLLTDKGTCEQLSIPGARLLQNKVRSWDKIVTANSLASSDSIEIANTKVPINSATYIEGVDSSKIERMSKMGIGGMTGNKLFLAYKLVIDTKNKKFGLIRDGKINGPGYPKNITNVL